MSFVYESDVMYNINLSIIFALRTVYQHCDVFTFNYLLTGTLQFLLLQVDNVIMRADDIMKDTILLYIVIQVEFERLLMVLKVLFH